MTTKSLALRQHEARLARARAMRNIADIERMKRQWAAEEHAKTAAGVYEAEMRDTERNMGPSVRKWSLDIAVIEAARDPSFTGEDYVRLQLERLSRNFRPGVNDAGYWKK